MATAPPVKKPWRRSPLLHKCQVCQDDANSHVHYGVRHICHSCKAFFRRIVRNSLELKTCYMNCEIAAMNRTTCLTCRFKKCKMVGMDPNLVLEKEDLRRRSAKKSTNKAVDTEKTSTNEITEGQQEPEEDCTTRTLDDCNSYLDALEQPKGEAVETCANESGSAGSDSYQINVVPSLESPETCLPPDQNEFKSPFGSLLTSDEFQYLQYLEDNEKSTEIYFDKDELDAFQNAMLTRSRIPDHVLASFHFKTMNKMNCLANFFPEFQNINMKDQCTLTLSNIKYCQNQLYLAFIVTPGNLSCKIANLVDDPSQKNLSLLQMAPPDSWYQDETHKSQNLAVINSLIDLAMDTKCFLLLFAITLLEGSKLTLENPGYVSLTQNHFKILLYHYLTSKMGKIFANHIFQRFMEVLVQMQDINEVVPPPQYPSQPPTQPQMGQNSEANIELLSNLMDIFD